MIVSVGLESGMESRSLAWALDFPGCCAYGQDDSEALLKLPSALVNYANRIAQRAEYPWFELGDFDVRLVETWQVYWINDQFERANQGYEVNAWFQHDWKPLTRADILHGLQLLRWNRADLLAITAGLTPEQLEHEYPGERWSINGILKHLGGAEEWYLDRLGLADRSRTGLPADPAGRLQVVRARLEAVLPDLAGKDQVVGKQGEFWSPRKLLRRALWHEIEHIQHILNLLIG